MPLLAALLACALMWGSPVASAAPVAPAVAKIGARAAIVIEPDTGEVLYARRANTREPIASTTKLMTALLTLQHEPLNRRFTVAYYPAGSDESTIGLRAGERLSVADLLRAMLLASANEAAYTLALRVGGSEAAFVREMNAEASALGLTPGTHYATPVGLDVAGNYSTAADLVRLAEIDLRYAFFARTVDEATVRLRTGAHPRTVTNRNDLVGRYPFVDGVKTGHTSRAGYVLVAGARSHGVRLLSVVLGDRSIAARDADTLVLLRYGLSRYDPLVAVRAGQVLAHAGVRFAGGRVALVAARTVTAVAQLGQRAQLSVAGVPARLSGPLAAGTREGTVTVRLRGSVIARVALVTTRALPAPTLGQRLRDYLSGATTILLLVVLVACSLMLVALRRRALRLARARRDQRAVGNG